MINSATEKFLPSFSFARMEDPDFEGDHGVDAYEHPSNTSLATARNKVRLLEESPLTAYVLTHSQQDFMLELQHWFSRGYYCGDSSALVCREDLQSAQLFKTLV